MKPVVKFVEKRLILMPVPVSTAVAALASAPLELTFVMDSNLSVLVVPPA